MYWAMYMMSNIFGNGIGAIMLSISTGPIFFIGCGALMLIVAYGQTRMEVPRSKTPTVHRTVKQEVTGALNMIVDKRMMYFDA